MAKNIIGSSKEELYEVSETMVNMLKNNGPVPEGKWSELAFLQPVKDYKSRHSSTMLTFEAVNEAMNNIK